MKSVLTIKNIDLTNKDVINECVRRKYDVSNGITTSDETVNPPWKEGSIISESVEFNISCRWGFKIVSRSAMWSMFGYNAQRTGLCPYDTSGNTGALKWKYLTGSPVESSPAIASDGTIYVGSDDNYLYAIK
jgi:outer membrane protein assembly factor BamB